MTKRPLLVILALPRSGTNLLRDIISGTGDYVNANEIFLPPGQTGRQTQPFNFWRVMDGIGLRSGPPTSRLQAEAAFAEYMRIVSERAGGKGLCIDIKHAHIASLGEQNGEKLLFPVLAGLGACFIHLRRRNILEQVASHRRALLTKEWIRNDWLLSHRPVQDVRITFDMNKLINELTWHEKSQQQLLDLVLPFDPLVLHYEDLLEDGKPSHLLRESLASVMQLHVREDYEPSLMKISPPLDHLVENMEEVRRILQGTRFERYLTTASTAPTGNTAAAWRNETNGTFRRLMPLCRPGSGIAIRLPALPIDIAASPDSTHSYVVRPLESLRPGLHALVVTGSTRLRAMQLLSDRQDESIISFPLRAHLTTRHGFAALFLAEDKSHQLRIETQSELPAEAVSLHHLFSDRPDFSTQDQGRPADVVVIGAQDPGSSDLARLFTEYPAVWIHPLRDVSFHASLAARQNRLCRMIENGHGLTRNAKGVGLLIDYAFTLTTDASWYRRMFRFAPRRSLLLDVAPGYAAFSEEEIQAFKAAAPGARIIFVMRNPVDLVLDAGLHRASLKKGGQVSLEQVAETCLSPEILERADYRTIITRWEDIFGRRNVKMVFQEDLTADPGSLLADVGHFLDIEPPGQLPQAGPQDERPHLLRGADLAGLRSRLGERLRPQLEWLSLNFGRYADDWLNTSREPDAGS